MVPAMMPAVEYCDTAAEQEPAVRATESGSGTEEGKRLKCVETDSSFAYAGLEQSACALRVPQRTPGALTPRRSALN